jgi:hypothetical protein
MSYLEPENTTLGDICRASLKECGAIGVGQTPLAEDINDAWARLQWMLMQWERKRWLVYHLVDLAKVSTGAVSYSVGPSGDFDTGTGSMRPTRLASAFTRKLHGPGPVFLTDDARRFLTDDAGNFLTADGPVTGISAGSNDIDYGLEILESREDYNRITLKGLVAGPGEAAFLDTDFPLARLFVWPIPQPFIYEIHASFYAQLQVRFATPATLFDLPWEYYNAMMLNLAIRLRPKYRLGTYPGDPLPGMAKDSLAVLRSSQVQVARLRMPNSIRRRGLYNIFSDRPY